MMDAKADSMPLTCGLPWGGGSSSTPYEGLQWEAAVALFQLIRSAAWPRCSPNLTRFSSFLIEFSSIFLDLRWFSDVFEASDGSGPTPSA